MSFRRRIAIGLGPHGANVLAASGPHPPFERATDPATAGRGDLLLVVAALGGGAVGGAREAVAAARSAGALVVGVAWPFVADALARGRDVSALLACCDTVVEVPPRVASSDGWLLRDPLAHLTDTLVALADVVPIAPSHPGHARRLRELLARGGSAPAGIATARSLAGAFAAAAGQATAGGRRVPASALVVVEASGGVPGDDLREVLAAAVALTSRRDAVVARVVDPRLWAVRVTFVGALGRPRGPAPGAPAAPVPAAHVGVVAVPPGEEQAVPVVHVRTAAREGGT